MMVEKCFEDGMDNFLGHLEIMRSLKSLRDLSRGSLKWLETSLLAGMLAYLQSKESTQHTSLMITV